MNDPFIHALEVYAPYLGDGYIFAAVTVVILVLMIGAEMLRKKKGKR